MRVLLIFLFLKIIANQVVKKIKSQLLKKKPNLEYKNLDSKMIRRVVYELLKKLCTKGHVLGNINAFEHI